MIDNQENILLYSETVKIQFVAAYKPQRKRERERERERGHVTFL
jgi:hypothetical protein